MQRVGKRASPKTKKAHSAVKKKNCGVFLQKLTATKKEKRRKLKFLSKGMAGLQREPI